MSHKHLLPLLALPLLVSSACAHQGVSERGGNGDKADSATALDPAGARARIQMASDAIRNSLQTLERSGEQLAYAAGQTPVADLLSGGEETQLPADQDVDDFFAALVGEENYEGQGTYLLGPDLFCEDGDFVCVDQVISAQMRVFLGVSDEELIIKPMFGPNRVAPIILAASDDGDRLTASVEFDLGATKETVEHLGSVFEFPVALPEVMTGAGFIDVERIGTAGLSTLALGLLSDIRIEGADYGFSLDQAPSRFTDFIENPEDALLIEVPDDVTQESLVHMHLGDMQLVLPWSALGQEATGGMLVEWEGMVLDMVGTDDSPIDFRVLGGDSSVFVDVDGVQSEATVTYDTTEVRGTIDGVGVGHASFPDTIGELVTYRDGFGITTRADDKASSHSIAANSQILSVEIGEADQAQLDASLAQQSGDPTATAASLECIVSGTYNVTVDGEATAAGPGQCILEIKGDTVGTLYAAIAP